LKNDIRIIESSGMSGNNVVVIPILAQKVDRIIKQVAMQLKEEFNL